MTGANAADHRLASRLASETGAALLELRNQLVAEGATHTELRRAGDQRAHDLIVAALAEAVPDDPVRSEEGGMLAGAGARRLWVIDPLDGTWQYPDPLRTDWAVHIGLAIDGVAVVGAVAIPARGVLLSTAEPPPTPVHDPGRPPRLVVSRSRPPVWTAAVARALGAETIALGSAGVKAMAVVLGDADAYVHDGGQHEWDSAAPVAVAAAAGCHVSRVDGSPLRYGAPDPWLPDVIVCRPELAEAVLAALGSERTS